MIISCVGDSITLGNAVVPVTPYPELLATSLGVTVYNDGISGSTTDGWLSSFAGMLSGQTPTHVTVMLGTNDAIPGWVTLVNFEANLLTIVSYIRGIGAIPVLLTPPPLLEARETSGRTNAVTVDYAQVVRDVCIAESLLMIDVWAALYPFKDTSSYFLETDGVHLIGPGYTVITNLLTDALMTLTPVPVPFGGITFRSSDGTEVPVYLYT
jgi:acyl-CoA thioesterase-1